MTAIEKLNLENAVPIGFLTDLISTNTAEEVRHTYSHWCRRVTGSERSAIGLPHNDKDMVVCAVSSWDTSTEGRRYPINGSTLGEAYLTKKTIMVDDLANQASEGCRVLAAMGMETVLVVPILSGERCFGVISTSYREPKEDVAKRIPTLEVIAGCLSTHLLLIEKIDELQVLSRTDPLTGALNRHRLSQVSDRLWSDWQAIGRPFSVVSVDLDHFKMVNDTLGHAVGDTVLQEIVSRLKTQCRSGDHVVRLGGEEFCVLLGGVSTATAGTLVSRFFNAIREQPVKTSDGLVAVTASIGVASATYTDETFEDCLKRSDMALYHAKDMGRDRVEVF